MIVRSAGHFFFPEGSYNWILNLSNPLLSKLFITKHSWDLCNGSRVFHISHQRKHHITHLMLKHWTNHLWWEQLIEHRDHFLNCKVFLLFSFCFKHVQSHWSVQITWIKHNHIINAVFWNVGQDIHDQVSIWINHTNTFAVFHVLLDQVLQEHRFTRTRLTNSVNVSASVSALDLGDGLFISVRCLSKSKPVSWHVGWWCSFFSTQPDNSRSFCRWKWGMPQAGHFFCVHHKLVSTIKGSVNKIFHQSRLQFWHTRNKRIPVLILIKLAE